MVRPIGSESAGSGVVGNTSAAMFSRANAWRNNSWSRGRSTSRA
jgi:hypothetical protein